MALTTVDQGLLGTYAQYTGFKNRIINGAMMIDQRNAGASLTPTSNAYTLDRWYAEVSASSKFSVQQNAGSITPPAGFKNYLGITSLSAYTVGAAETFNIQQRIEGLNFYDLGWGTASAQTVTLSFWVRSSLTGTFGGAVGNQAYNRSYPFSYTISSANTWEQKTITIPGDTTGTWLTTNGLGLFLVFGLGVGSTNSGTAGAWAGTGYNSVTGAVSVVGTNGATFYITGVQLEKGSTATSFDYRPYGTELQLCQRYYQYIGGAIGGGQCNGSAQVLWAYNFPVPLRTTSPSYTLLLTSWNAGITTYYVLDGAGSWIANSGAAINSFTMANNTNLMFQINGFTGLTSGRVMLFNYANNLISVSAEL